MIITTLDLQLLVAVPATVAVLEAILWRLAVRRIKHRPRTSGAPGTASPARDTRPAPAARTRLIMHAAGDAAPVSRHSRR